MVQALGAQAASMKTMEDPEGQVVSPTGMAGDHELAGSLRLWNQET